MDDSKVENIQTIKAEDIKIVSEAIVVVDLVDSTKMIIRHGWESVGRQMLRSLRACIASVGSDYGLVCRKFTGDGYMLTFSNSDTAQSVIEALKAIVEICHNIEKVNKGEPEQNQIRLRFALHYGQADAVEEDREGPVISFTFRLGAVASESLEEAYNPMQPDIFPVENYVILSEEAVDILQEREHVYHWEPIGLLPLKGFRGFHQLYVLRNLSKLSKEKGKQLNEENHFDVFLCHNSIDKPRVIEIAQQLRERGLSPWLDEWELQPGMPWQRLLEAQITQIQSAAIFVGHEGIGPWQIEEVDAFLRQFVNRGCPVIPVLLETTPEIPPLPIFLEGRTWVDFRQAESDPIARLIWGITGKKP